MSDDKRDAAARAGHHCGDLGHRNQAGEPCGQITARGKACPHHGPPELALAHQKKAGLIAQLKHQRVLPEDAKVPEFESPEAIRRWAGEMALLVGTGKLEPRLADTMRGFAVLALTTHELAVIARLELLEGALSGKPRPSLSSSPLRLALPSRRDGESA